MLENIKRKIIELTGIIAALLLVPMVIIAIVQVTSRYFFNSPVTFTEELLRFLLIWAGMFGAIYCFGTARHLSLNFLAERLSPRNKIVLQCVVNILILIFCTTILLFGGLTIVLATTEQLSATMRIPMSYIYAILPISGLLISTMILLDIIKYINILKTLSEDK